MSSRFNRIARRLLASAVVFQFGFAEPMLPFALHGAAAAEKRERATGLGSAKVAQRTGAGRSAAKASPRSATRAVTADQLLVQTQRSLTLTVAAAKRARAIRSKAAAPFVKALGEASKALTDLRSAASARNGKRFSRSLSQASRAMGRLNATYRLAELKEPALRKGVGDVARSWTAYLARAGGSRTAATPQSTRENARRIAALKTRLSGLRDRRSRSPREARELRRMLDALDRAQSANLAAASQWLALALLNDVFGWYGGYYDYIVVYEPAFAREYRDEYVYWQNVSQYNDVQYESYYESYSFTSYEETVVVEESSYVEFSSEETTLISQEQQSVETDIGALYRESESFGALSGETVALEAAAEQQPPAADEDPANTANPAVDAAAALDEDAAPLEAADAFVSAAPDGPEADAPEPDAQSGNDAAPADAAGPDEAQSSPSAGSDADEPAADEPTANDDEGAEPPGNASAAEAPATESSAADGAEAAEPGAPEQPGDVPDEADAAPEEPDSLDGAAENGAPDEPAAEEGAPEEAVGEEPEAEEPAAEEPAAEEPAAEEPATEEPATEEPAEEEPAAEEAEEEPAAEEPAVEQEAEEPAGEEPAEQEAAEDAPAGDDASSEDPPE